MAAHEPKLCPRCDRPFECKPGNITACQCFGLVFSGEEKEFIGAQSSDCLCRDCLQALKHEFRYQATKTKLEQMQSIIQGK